MKKIQEEVGNLETIKEELKAISTCQSGVDKSLGSMVSSLEDKISSIMTTINEIELAQLLSNKRSTTMSLKSSQTLPGL
jgi:DNA anti-recombination protein RmuC